MGFGPLLISFAHLRSDANLKIPKLRVVELSDEKFKVRKISKIIRTQAKVESTANNFFIKVKILWED